MPSAPRRTVLAAVDRRLRRDAFACCGAARRLCSSRGFPHRVSCPCLAAGWRAAATPRALRGLLMAALLLVAPWAMATFHTFRIQQLYSNADGSVQFIVLHEASNLNGQGEFDGQSLSVTQGGVRKVLEFNRDIGAATAGRSVLIATTGYAALGIVVPDFTVADRFLPTDGGVVNFAGVDSLNYAALPIDGVNALYRGGSVAPNAPVNLAGNTGMVPDSAVTSVEFYNPGLDHYFISALAPDIDALDSGRLAGWARTGQSFRVFPTQASGGGAVNPVCRIYIPPDKGDSHFFSASPMECADTIAKFPFMVFESASVFYVGLPDTATGACDAGMSPVYRVWNNRPDSNHRYLTDRTLRDGMVAAGGIAEGYGPDQVILCAAP